MADRNRAINRLALASIAFAVVFGLWQMIRDGDHLPEARRDAANTSATVAAASRAPALESSSASAASASQSRPALPIEAEDLERDRRETFLWWLDAIMRDPTRATLNGIGLWIGTSVDRLDLLIDYASDDEIAEALTALTNMTDRDLDGVHDLQAYARRIGRVALAHRFGEEVTMGDDAPLEPPAFIDMTDRVEDGRPIDPTDQFDEDPGRVYAVVPTAAVSTDHLIAKWFQQPSGDLIHVGSYPVDRNQSSMTLWWKPHRPWRSGDYVVEIYNDGSVATPAVARGEFAVN